MKPENGLAAKCCRWRRRPVSHEFLRKMLIFNLRLDLDKPFVGWQGE
jgi:hypothetical protein